jgi:hypothetical protein
MSRRRYISSAISLDRVINKLASEAGDFAVLLYTWMIPHAEDAARITGDPEELLYMVVPGRRDKTVDDVESALLHMASLRLIAWRREEGAIYFNTESFYRYQAYIPTAKRADNSRYFSTNGDKRQKAPEVATNPASLSPSPSPKKKTSSSADADDGFSDFWMAYPRKIGKAECIKRWRRMTKTDRSNAILAASNLSAHIASEGVELQYVPHPATFIGPKRKWEDWVSGPPAGYDGAQGIVEKDSYCPDDGATLQADGHCPVCQKVVTP